MRIGIFGVELNSINYGCAALGISQLKFLEEVSQKNKVELEYYIFSNDDINKLSVLKNILEIKSNIEIKGLINFKNGLKGWKKISTEIDKCDYIIDLTYGDSFSDIYGFKNFLIYTIPKLITIYNKKSLIIAPQTIGPYQKFITKILAKRVLKHTKYLCVRDEKSLNLAKDISKRDDILLTSDLAMELPYKKSEINNKKFNVGINVSDLLYTNTNEENKNKYGIVIDYKELVKKIIDKFSNEKYQIHLITHVFSRDDTKGEFALAKKIHEEYPNTILAPKFDSPIDAKNYISGLDLFFGARMHATMGAFSSGVPIIPTSYSRKFEGLYGSLGYNYGINLRETTIEEAMKHIDYCLENYNKVEEDRKKAFDEALKRNECYHKLLEKIINKGK